MRLRSTSRRIALATWLLVAACARGPQTAEQGDDGRRAGTAAAAAAEHGPGDHAPADHRPAAAAPADHQPAGHAPAGQAGVTGLDVVAHGDLVDLLTAEGAGEVTRLTHRRSRDGGRTWSAPVAVPTGDLPVAPVHRGVDPQVAAAGDRLLVAWTARGSSPWGTGPIAAAASSDGGRTWSPAAPPADDGSTGGHGFLDLAAAGDGTFHAVWLDGRDGVGQGLRHAASRDGGASWSRNTSVDDRTCECCWNELLADGEEVLVLYRDHDPRDLRLVASTDGGTSWQDRGRPGAFDWAFDGCPHVGGALARAGEVLAALDWTGAEGRAGLHVATTERPGSWSAPRRLGGPHARHADLAAHRGTLVAVWDEGIDGSTELHWSRSTDDGLTWASPERIQTRGGPSHPLLVPTTAGVLVVWTEEGSRGNGTWSSVLLPPWSAAVTGRVLTDRAPGAAPRRAR